MQLGLELVDWGGVMIKATEVVFLPGYRSELARMEHALSLLKEYRDSWTSAVKDFRISMITWRGLRRDWGLQFVTKYLNLPATELQKLSLWIQAQNKKDELRRATIESKTSDDKADFNHDDFNTGHLEPPQLPISLPALKMMSGWPLDVGDLVQSIFYKTGMQQPSLRRWLSSRNNLHFEQTAVGDETGVQGRWGQHVNRLISVVFLSQNIDMQSGDFRATTSRYSKVPSMVGASRVTGALHFVGEIKAPWVDKHDFSEGMGDEDIVRHILGGSGWVLPISAFLDDFNTGL